MLHIGGPSGVMYPMMYPIMSASISVGHDNHPFLSVGHVTICHGAPVPAGLARVHVDPSTYSENPPFRCPQFEPERSTTRLNVRLVQLHRA